MGARHSRKSMDVTTTPKKDGVTVEGGDASVVGDGKLERIEEADVKPTTNGTASHNETTDDKDVINDKDTVTEKEKDKDTVVEKDDTEKKEEAEVKVEETKSEAPVETTAESTESVTTPTEETPASPTTATSPDSKESKKKDKPKKWFRSISFGKKDKSKPVRDEAAKNGDVTKEETLAEGSEEAENAATSPSEDKSIVASPTETEAAAVVAADAPATVDETKEAEKSSIVEKNETPSSPTDPTPVPSEETKDGDNEKIENKIEVSLVETEILMPSKTKPIITTSVISRKTSEEFPSQLPSSPPPTPIDPSPLQQAQQTPANATALAEALKLPAETIKSTNVVDNNIIKINDESVKINDIIIQSEEGPVPVTPENIETTTTPTPTTTTAPIVISNEQQQDDIKNDNMPIDVEEKVLNIINVDEDIKVEEKLNNQVVEEKIIEINTTTLLDTPIIDDKKMNIIEENNDTTVINNTVIINDDNIIEKNVEILESPKAPSTLSFEEIETTKSDATDEIPPPLPESPIPLPKANNDLLNFMSTQIADVPIVSNEIIIIKDNNKNNKIDIDEIKNDVIITNGKDNIEIISPPSFEQQQQQQKKQEDDDDEEKEEKKDNQKEIIDDTDDLENLPPPPEEQISNNQADSILTPPRSPSPTDFPPPIIVDNSFTIQNGNENHKLNDDDIISEDLHVEMKHNGDIINIDQCPLTILKNDQNTIEPEAVVEKTKEITKEIVEEAPKVSTPTVLVEAPVSSVPAGPVITEDVASVTQAIEEIDINEKAVAAAVNENIEAVKTNEIIADKNHQNTLKE
ncbi:A-kinase anchor protein 200 isoform X2 [Aphidius gifuensis]|uniref:A-kinase anchor protein 200 isoform X2 n=1 Tax=Aphidius gifuensis TaxID=684658 RepID=UPI001CDC6B20|nr:A-kinase anchor protein 200 isoform X2 [Aphidius gifuensis]XP_044008011.1 A-kinase anchor protein 200 isoform X2 [Aphidius gifuensis]